MTTITLTTQADVITTPSRLTRMKLKPVVTHVFGVMVIARAKCMYIQPETVNPRFPMTLDLRWKS